MRLIRGQSARRVRPVQGEEGFTVILAILAMFLLTAVTAVAIAATEGDLHLVKNDLHHKRAYEAAQAGIADYAYHLAEDTTYWTYCTTVPSPSAVNQQGSTANRRSVAGSTEETYAIELLPATGQSSCNPASPTTSMLESTGPNTGTFRIRSTGYTGNVKHSIVASFKRASFLDYVYFTQLETSDPVTYPPASIPGAYTQCTKTVQQGRYGAPIPGSSPSAYCDFIVFRTGEVINGPLHTNDALLICGTPAFGRTSADVIEVSAAPPGWYGVCGAGDSPSFVGAFITNAPVLTPPPTNGQLANIALPAYKWTGQIKIVLSGTNMTVTNTAGSTSTVAIPSNGLVYVSNGSCSTAYSPYTATYPTSFPATGCGNVRVSGTYSGQLTIAAENDIIIEGNVTRTGNGMLGLIANNFVRVKHPICPSTNLGCTSGTITSQTARGVCNSGVNGTGSTTNLNIDAAMLAINHSFIIDHFDCGASLGTLTVNGAIAQRFRGAVGTFGASSTGYSKSYNYDDRLHYQEPPQFLDPVQSSWHVQRETLDFP